MSNINALLAQRHVTHAVNARHSLHSPGSWE